MNALQIYTATAACLLSIAGIASFPYRLSYGNTSWMPRCMRPGSEYLERQYEYRYPVREIDVIFSVLLFFIGFAVLLFMSATELHGGIPANRWFTSLAVLLPGWASCRMFSLRTDYGDGFCYASRLTAFRYWKVSTVIVFTEAVFILYLSGLLPLPVYRIVAVALSVCCFLLLLHDFLVVYRRRGDNEYSDPIGFRQMYPKSLILLSFPLLSSPLLLSLWWNPSVCIIIFSILLVVYTVSRYVCRFHPSVNGDEHERNGYLLYMKRKPKRIKI